MLRRQVPGTCPFTTEVSAYAGSGIGQHHPVIADYCGRTSSWGQFMLDILIIGAGLSGMCAAYAAVKAGLDVRIVAKGQGATHWHAGTIDVLGYLPREDAPILTAFDAMNRLVQDGGEHPYAILGVDAVRAALDDFIVLSDEIRLPYRGSGEEGRNLRLPSPVGAARPLFLAPEAQLPGRLDSGQPMLVVGFEGFVGFYPKLMADNLCAQGHAARAAFLPLSLITTRRDFNNVWLAEIIEDDANLNRLAEALALLVRPGERIGLPAFLGFRHHEKVMDRLRQATGAPIFEIPILPPSVPGIRFHDRLARYLTHLGVRIEIGMEVIGFHAEGDQIRWVETATSARPLKHRARHFLLATGGILGGGIDSTAAGRVWETIFDLPLTNPQQRTHWFRPHFWDPAGQPVFQGGVRVDQSLQPVDASGNRIYANLWAAGGILAGTDPIQERSLEGIAVSTGMAAARKIMSKE
ncbi:MAG: glycerol-3-phosphate dehydrogenase subunit GlpB [Caldilineaceae bacterium]|nr:glycerol-3-phosphate dehydrogenase subunit GlpB [Caldilineaceae bacterium]